MSNLADRYELSGDLAEILAHAEEDTDRVSMLTLGDKGHSEAAIVIIKGHAEIELFRQWAERNKIFNRESSWIQGPVMEPRTQCPECGAWVADHDGFGVLAHTKPAYKDGCGYCSHPTRDGGVCGICGDDNG